MVTPQRPLRNRHTRRTGTALTPSATRMRVTPHSGPSTRWLAAIRGARDGPPRPPHRGTVECAAYPDRLRVIRRGESPRRPYLVSRQLCFLDGGVAADCGDG